MSEEQLKAFLEKLKADTSLQEKLKAAADTDAVVAIATEAGFSISADDFNKAELEVSDKEMENAAGGGASCMAGCGEPMSPYGDCCDYSVPKTHYHYSIQSGDSSM